MFLPDNIDFEAPDRYNLSIRISPTHFSYFIYEKRIGGESCYRETRFKEESDILTDIQQIIFEFNFLTLPFNQTNIVMVSKDYELIPAYLLEEDKMKELYNFTHNNKYERVLSSPLQIQENVTLFGFDENIYKFVMRSLFNPQFYHHTTLVLKQIEEHKQTSIPQSSLFLNIHDQFVDIFLYDNSFNLKYNTTIEGDLEINLLYYIMNIWDKSELDQLNDRLYIIESGRNKKQELVDLLKGYIRHIEIKDISSPNFLDINKENNSLIPVDLLIQQ